jgi:hypothetical protein
LVEHSQIFYFDKNNENKWKCNKKND